MKLHRLVSLSRLVSAAGLVVASVGAQANGGVHWSVNVDAPLQGLGRISTEVSSSPRGRAYAVPVVYAPQPVVYAPAPVIVRPYRPVYAQPVVYVPPRPVYRAVHEGWHWRHEHRHHHGHAHGYGGRPSWGEGRGEERMMLPNDRGHQAQEGRRGDGERRGYRGY